MMNLGARTAFILSLAVVTALAAVIGSRDVFAATVVVSPSNMNGWAFQTIGDATGDFVTGPSGAGSLGSGSAHLTNGSAPSSQISSLGTVLYNGRRLSDIAAGTLEYSAYATTHNGDNVAQPFVYIIVSTPDGLDELKFDPNAQTPHPTAADVNRWMTWNLRDGVWVSSRTSPRTLSEYILRMNEVFGGTPDDIVIAGWEAWPGGVRFQVGPVSDIIDSNVDNFTIDGTTYDFDPDVATSPTSTFTPTATFTATSTPTPTPTATATSCPGACPPTSTFTPTATPPLPVGGMAEQPDVAGLTPAAALSGRNYTLYILGFAGAGVAALGAGAWVTRRRRKVG